MKKGLKFLLTGLSILIIIVASVGTTIAYLTSKSESVTNSFTVGKIEISLTETTSNYKLVPGLDVAKDPKITVKAGSEACYLFVELDIDADLDNVISYELANGWTALSTYTNVYYRTVEQVDIDTEFYVLKDNKVTVNFDATVADINKASNQTLTFTAYACQSLAVATVDEAWSILNPQP